MKKENITFIISIIILVSVVGVLLIFLLNLRSSVEGILQPVVNANSTAATQISRLMQPTPTIIPDPVTIIHEINSLAKLETIQYTVEKVITAEVGQGIFQNLFGDKLLLVAHGSVIAGIDLSKLTVDDIHKADGKLTVTLPKAEVFSASLDNDKSYIFDRRTGIFSQGNVNLETEARKAAEAEIYKAAIDDGILEQAQVNAENVLTRLLNSLGYRNFEFN